MGRRWVAEVEVHPDGTQMYCGDRVWTTGKLERRSVTISYAKLFVTKREALAGAKLRGFKNATALRTWW